MRIKEIAKVVANTFNEYIKEDGLENFKELRNNNDWDASDIKSEIESIVTIYLNKEYDNGNNIGIMMMDDCSMINDKDKADPDRYCTYGQFKKMVMAEVK